MDDVTRSGVDRPSFADMVEGTLVFITGPVLGATICPGMLLCVPGLVLFGAAIAIPILLLGGLALVMGAIAAIPYLLVRSGVRRLGRPCRGRSSRG